MINMDRNLLGCKEECLTHLDHVTDTSGLLCMLATECNTELRLQDLSICINQPLAEMHHFDERLVKWQRRWVRSLYHQILKN